MEKMSKRENDWVPVRIRRNIWRWLKLEAVHREQKLCDVLGEKLGRPPSVRYKKESLNKGKREVALRP